MASDVREIQGWECRAFVIPSPGFKVRFEIETDQGVDVTVYHDGSILIDAYVLSDELDRFTALLPELVAWGKSLLEKGASDGK
jgi:hypothetical protein